MTPSTEELIAIARHYWRADDLYDSRTEPSPEFERFEALWNEKLKELDRWRALLNQLRRALPECTVGDYVAASVNGCFGALVYPLREEVLQRTQLSWTVVGYLSILAPVYTVHCVRREFVGTHLKNSQVFLEPIPLELQGIADVIAQRIEEDYGATALPLEVAQTPVSLYVHFMKPPQTTLFHALFSSEPGNIP
ncbi:hypothetical protein [Corallococcus terminator]|uniref:Uncharacterized protein n=1 Tax=Corallococcus terminator TaxID=2316733 RepID=A0A3A8IM45_9BACT|nr:hypothetical protein [Corallococcus terminator]RKG84517.1 hypothetical protein D7V88_21820 [Corallococcus terminator]